MDEITKARKKEYQKRYYEENKEKLKQENRLRWHKNKDRYSESNKRYRETHRDELAENNKVYWKENNERLSEQKKEYYQRNREAKLEYRKKHYELNRDKLINYGRTYYNDNKVVLSVKSKQWRINNRELRICLEQKRRAKKKLLPSNFTNSDWQEVKKYFNDSCSYCGEQTNLTQDHFVPVSNGGGYIKDNIIPACVSCNCSKQDKDFYKWFPLYKHYSKQREQKIIEYINNN